MEKDAKIYVAGHRGMVGSAICRALAKNGYTNIVTKSHSELNLCRQDEVEHFFEREKPAYVFLAAARVGGILANSEAPARSAPPACWVPVESMMGRIGAMGVNSMTKTSKIRLKSGTFAVSHSANPGQTKSLPLGSLPAGQKLDLT